LRNSGRVAGFGSMTGELSITDPQHRPHPEGAFKAFWMRYLNDERDLPFIWLSLAMTAVLVPFAVVLFATDLAYWWLAPVYWAVLFGAFFDRYILMLHNTSHRRLFKRKYKVFNHYIPWVLGPFCGETPETYFVHHMTMHHAEGNMPDDLSSTMPYQRDDWRHFFVYWARFFFFVLPEMARYQLKRGRRTVLRRLLVGELGYYAVMIGLAFISWKATLVVFIVPFLLARFLMMCGNWGQHAFVDADDPANSYKNSITCINTAYNRRCFNDGYHIGHHVTANRHWTDMPRDFLDNRATYVKEDAVVFEGIDFFMVWAFLMLRRYDWLAERFVELRDEPRSKEEIIALLKRRTRRFENLATA
jgi:hypothetical protein